MQSQNCGRVVVVVEAVCMCVLACVCACMCVLVCVCVPSSVTLDHVLPQIFLRLFISSSGLEL